MRKITYLTILACFAFGTLMAQPLNQMNPDKMLGIAEEQLAAGDIYNALSWYEKAYNEEEDGAVAAKIASLHYALRDYKMAESWYAKMASAEDATPSFDYARILKYNGKYDAAVQQFEKLLTTDISATTKQLAQMEIKGAKMAKNMKQSDKLTVSDAGDVMNSPYTEFGAVYNGDAVYYGSLTSSDVLVVEDDDLASNEKYYAKIFKATDNGGTWQKELLSNDVNRLGFHTGNPSFSADGKQMYFTRTGLRGNILNSSEIYVSAKTGDAWSAAEKVEGLEGICKHPAVGELFGKKVLYFAAEKADSKGGFDIYYAPFVSANKVGDAVNLGGAVNTAGNEETPFYSNNTLYFSSTGHAGMGGYDIFHSTHDGTKWSAIQNAGKGINSNQDDMYFTASNDGLKGFVVSNRPSSRSLKSETCCDDIYAFEIEPVIVDLIVNAVDAETGEALGTVAMKLSPKTGAGQSINVGQKVGLTLNEAYTVAATLVNYEDASISFNTVGINDSKTIEKTIKLKAIPQYVDVVDTIWNETREPIVLNNIFYKLNKWDILPEAEGDLSYLLKLMNDYPTLKIELGSHTDVRGGNDFNQSLSQKRSESAKAWLVERGVSTDRISAVGYGETQPRNQCLEGVKCSDEDHKYNRRTEFKIIEGPTNLTTGKKFTTKTRRVKVKKKK